MDFEYFRLDRVEIVRSELTTIAGKQTPVFIFTSFSESNRTESHKNDIFFFRLGGLNPCKQAP